MKTIYISEDDSRKEGYFLELTKYTDGDIVVSVVDENKNDIPNYYADSAYLIFNKNKQKELISILKELLEEQA